MRRVITCFVLAVMVVSSLETAVADVRTGPNDSDAPAQQHISQDSSFHHQSSNSSNDDHGHHGAAGDHCTHAHTFALAFSVFVFPISGTAAFSFFPGDELTLGFVMPPTLRPPIL